MAESETIPQMREQIDKLNGDLKKQQDAAAELSKENRLLKARDVFREQGYDPVHGELFATSNSGEITAEAVDEFAGKYGLVPTTKEASEEGTQSDETGADDSDDGMSSFSRAGSGAGTGGAAGPQGDVLTREEWVALSKSNPAAAKEAVAGGRVQLRDDNPWRA